ncbi:MAG TPA: DUF202 domain-containing protein [Polyangiaceae bacterium]|nr:DUF202 domain-containing protein [Polyangiaceae bacterium]
MLEAPKAPEKETLQLHLANERTMLAWVRTGIALMAFGFAIARFGVFARQMATLGGATAPAPNGASSGQVGAALVALGMLANLLATFRHAQIRQAILRGKVGAPRANLVYAFGIIATIVGLAMTVLLVRALGD